VPFCWSTTSCADRAAAGRLRRLRIREVLESRPFAAFCVQALPAIWMDRRAPSGNTHRRAKDFVTRTHHLDDRVVFQAVLTSPPIPGRCDAVSSTSPCSLPSAAPARPLPVTGRLPERSSGPLESSASRVDTPRVRVRDVVRLERLAHPVAAHRVPRASACVGNGHG